LITRPKNKKSSSENAEIRKKTSWGSIVINWDPHSGMYVRTAGNLKSQFGSSSTAALRLEHYAPPKAPVIREQNVLIHSKTGKEENGDM
jgi:hypothetical protein